MLKPTAKGNLPRKFCWHAALSYWGEETYLEDTRFGDINKEEDVFELHVTRLVAGLIRKYKGKFILSRDFDAREPAPKGWAARTGKQSKRAVFGQKRAPLSDDEILLAAGEKRGNG